MGAAVVLGAVAAGQPQYLSSSASGALANQLDQRCAYTVGASIVGGVALSDAARQTAALDRRTARDLTAAGAPSRALGPSVTTLAIDGRSLTTSSGSSAPVTLYDRSGALSHVRIESSVAHGPDGVWLTDSVAAQLGVRAGDVVYFGHLGVPVAGLYANLQNYPRPLPPYWCSQETGESGYIGPPDANFPPPTLALVDASLLLRVARALSVQAVDYQWQRPVQAASLTFEQARATVAALAEMQTQEPAEGYQTRQGPRQMLPSDLSFVVDRSQAISQSVGHSVAPVTAAGMLVALVLMAAAASYWVDRRRQELVLLRSRGIGPGWSALKALLEMGPWALLGAVIGVVLSHLLVRLLGPSSLIGGGSALAGLATAGVVLIIGMAVVAGVAGVRVGSVAEAAGEASRSMVESPAGRRGITRSTARHAPWEIVVLAGAGVAWWRLSGTNPDLAPAGSSVASVSPLYLAFPALLVAGSAVLTARLVVLLLPWARRRSAAGTNTSRLLGVARLAAAPGLAGLLLAATAMAVGMLVFAAAVTVTQQGTVSAKARTFVGSDTGVFLTSGSTLPAPIRSQSTVILRLPQAFLDGQAVDVIGIDPATFSRAAYWSRAYGAGSLRSVLHRLEAPRSATGVLPVIVANGSSPPSAQLRIPVAASGLPVTDTVHVVETIPGFAGVNGGDTLVLTSASALAGLNGVSEVLSRLPAATVVSALARQGATVSTVVSADTVLDLSQFLSVTWSFAYLQALGILIGLIVVAGVALYIETRQRRRVVAYVIARRMGLSRVAHVRAVALELGAPLVVGAAAGMLLGMAGAAVVSGHLDPLPDLTPGPQLAWPGLVLICAGAATAMLWWVATAWSQRGAERSSAAVVLRGEL